MIDKKTYDLLYINEAYELFRREANFCGRKCYEALRGESAPCSSCPLNSHGADGKEHRLDIDIADHSYCTRFKEADWNGIPAYVEYLRDVTVEVQSRKKKERLEAYFRTVVKYMPGGVAVIRYDKSGKLIPEFMSEGFAAMTGRTEAEMLQIYQKEVTGCLHPDDKERTRSLIQNYIDTEKGPCEVVYRLMHSDGTYLWVRNTISVIQSDRGEKIIYAGYIDITKEQKEIRSQYSEMLMQHYRESGPDVLIVGHCNITQNRMLEVNDYTDSDMLHTYGRMQSGFYVGLAGLVTDEIEKRQFGEVFYNEPSILAYRQGRTELSGDYYIKFPTESHGRYARFVVKMVETPDTGDITGILSVTDITEETISGRIINRFSYSNYDTIVKVDLSNDCYEVLAGQITSEKIQDAPGHRGSHSSCLQYMLERQVAAKDQKHMDEMMNPEYMLKRLYTSGVYTFSYSIQNQEGHDKSMTISPVDLRLKRVCLAITDVTDILAAERQSQTALEKALALAKEASHAKSTFLTSMSHDIRTPMNAIMGMTTLALAQGTCICVELEFEPGAHGNGSGEKDENGVKPRQDAVLEGTKFPVVEDNVLNSEIMCELLKMCGAQAESQPDGLLGVEAFSSHAPGTYDAILMDIQMPRMNGYEASRANRELDREDAETIPIVAMTANAFTEDIMASKETFPI